MSLWTPTRIARTGQLIPPEALLERTVAARNFAQTCPRCTLRTLHSGCPIELFEFDRGRFMCDVYLDSFTG